MTFLTNELAEKVREHLHELIPQAITIAYLVPPPSETTQETLRDTLVTVSLNQVRDKAPE